jgi:hypothetical protein
MSKMNMTKHQGSYSELLPGCRHVQAHFIDKR